jgi:CRISPR system Cascade subunit CasE
MSWLSKMTLNKDKAFRMGKVDSYAFHCLLWECFPGEPDARRSELGILTRIDEEERGYILWLLARREPVRPAWCDMENFAVKEIAASFLAHRYYAFDLRANPVRTITQHDEAGARILRDNGKPSRGKRSPIVNMDELRTWLIRKSAVRSRTPSGEDIPGGFRIVDDATLQIFPMNESHFRKNKDESAFHGGVRFRGVLEVTDRDAFIDTYHAGIGPAKSFGFGLLLLSPINHQLEY